MGQPACRESEVVVLSVNGAEYELKVGPGQGRIATGETLADTLRENLGLTGTKVGCDQGGCGSCTVIMNGRPVLSCMILTVECGGAEIVTIEGLQDSESGRLDQVQEAFVDHTAFQCGFCTPGLIMASKSLLDENPAPTRAEVGEALAGHYCRCISHYQVLEAVLDAAHRKGGGRD